MSINSYTKEYCSDIKKVFSECYATCNICRLKISGLFNKKIKNIKLNQAVQEIPTPKSVQEVTQVVEVIPEVKEISQETVIYETEDEYIMV